MLSFLTLHIQFCPTTITIIATYTTHTFTFLNRSGKQAMVTMVMNRPLYLEAIFNPGECEIPSCWRPG
jgi:hypothetical protein